MNLVGDVLQVIQIFYGPINRRIHHVTDLKENVETLVKNARVLESKRLDIERDGEEGTRNDQILLNQVKKWLEDEGNIQKEISSIKTKFEKFNGCFPNYWSRYKLGKKAAKKLKDVEDINGRDNFNRVVANSSPPRVLEFPPASTLGQKSTAEQTEEKIWGYLHDELSGIICLYGMGGIGKTTLMRNINNKLFGTQDFDVVVWITVSKDYNLERVQKEILNRLYCKVDEWEEQRRARIYDMLKSKRYLLILDDLWNEISLEQVGIPKPDIQKRSKIAITTRFVGVCNNMEADVMIKVNTLSEVEAWKLFVAKVGEEVALQSNIQPLAEEVVSECGGLPLAISVVGKAMRGKTNERVWQNALRTLQESAPDIPGMEPKVFHLLKLSYDHLEDNKIKLCFLYCSLFPEDYKIDVDELVMYWVMERFIDTFDNLEDAIDKGHDIVERITDACLLEQEQRGNKYFVKMHDLIRDLALWITSSAAFSSSSKFFVRAGVGLKKVPHENMWSDAGRVSLMRNRIDCLPQNPPTCSNLVSLLLRENDSFCDIPSGFFQHMPTLEVLDLSGTSIGSMPTSLSSLVKLRALILRGCRLLFKLPLLGQLGELQFLDLSHTGIRELPQDMDKLVKLKKLNLSHLNELRVLQQNVISRLTNLEDLRIYGTYVNWANEDGNSKATLGEIAILTHLTTLEITINHIDCLVQDKFHLVLSTLRTFKIFICSGKTIHPEIDLLSKKLMQISDIDDHFPHGFEAMLQNVDCLYLIRTNLKCVSQLIGDSKSVRMIQIKYCNKTECLIDWTEVGHDALQNIEEFILTNLPNLKQLFAGQVPQGLVWKLKKISVFRCNNLKSLLSSEMVQHLDQLEVLHVSYCDGLEEIIQGNESLPDNPFPKLRSLELFNLSRLRGIIQRPKIALPALKRFLTRYCPILSLPECPRLQPLIGAGTWN